MSVKATEQRKTPPGNTPTSTRATARSEFRPSQLRCATRVNSATQRRPISSLTIATNGSPCATQLSWSASAIHHRHNTAARPPMRPRRSRILAQIRAIGS